jgi:hypothetical protein
VVAHEPSTTVQTVSIDSLAEGSLVCGICKEVGHWTAECPLQPGPSNSSEEAESAAERDGGDSADKPGSPLDEPEVGSTGAGSENDEHGDDSALAGNEEEFAAQIEQALLGDHPHLVARLGQAAPAECFSLEEEDSGEIRALQQELELANRELEVFKKDEIVDQERPVENGTMTESGRTASQEAGQSQKFKNDKEDRLLAYKKRILDQPDSVEAKMLVALGGQVELFGKWKKNTRALVQNSMTPRDYVKAFFSAVPLSEGSVNLLAEITAKIQDDGLREKVRALCVRAEATLERRKNQAQ